MEDAVQELGAAGKGVIDSLETVGTDRSPRFTSAMLDFKTRLIEAFAKASDPKAVSDIVVETANRMRAQSGSLLRDATAERGRFLGSVPFMNSKIIGDANGMQERAQMIADAANQLGNDLRNFAAIRSKAAAAALTQPSVRGNTTDIPAEAKAAAAGKATSASR